MTAPYRIRKEQGWWRVYRRDIRGGFICKASSCQDISYAGAGAGIDGERSGLWTEMLRLIRLVRPRFALVENVSALLTRGLSRVLGGLAESGYCVRWDCIPAAFIGAPHIRDRIWIVADSQRSGLAADLLAASRAAGEGREGAGKFWWRVHEPARQSGRWMAAAPEARVAAAAWEYAPCEPLLLGIPDGISRRVDRLRALGNAVVPQAAEWIGRRILEVA